MGESYTYSPGKMHNRVGYLDANMSPSCRGLLHSREQLSGYIDHKWCTRRRSWQWSVQPYQQRRYISVVSLYRRFEGGKKQRRPCPSSSTWHESPGRPNCTYSLEPFDSRLNSRHGGRFHNGYRSLHKRCSQARITVGKKLETIINCTSKEEALKNVRTIARHMKASSHPQRCINRVLVMILARTRASATPHSVHVMALSIGPLLTSPSGGGPGSSMVV